jgi:hypothetical protein
MLVESAGEEAFVRSTRFVDCDEQGAAQERTLFSADGKPLGPVETYTTSWAELQAHASFPADRTVIGQESIETPMGPLDCLRYTVTDGEQVDTFWFATAKPGMPVRYTSHVDGQVTSVVTMIGDERPGSLVGN